MFWYKLRIPSWGNVGLAEVRLYNIYRYHRYYSAWVMGHVNVLGHVFLFSAKHGTNLLET